MLHILCKAWNIVQKDLAKQSHIDIQKLSHFEHGQNDALEPQELLRLPAVFGFETLTELAKASETLPWERDKRLIGLALSVLQSAEGMTFQTVADHIYCTSTAVREFIHNGDQIAWEKVRELPPLFYCETLNEMVGKAIGMSLRRMREEQDMTIRQVADYVGKTPKELEEFENGKPTLNLETVRHLLSLLRCTSLHDMMGQASALAPEPDWKTIGLSLRRLGEDADMSPTYIAEQIESWESAISKLEHLKAPLGWKKMLQLPRVFGCATLREMVAKSLAKKLPFLCEKAGIGEDEVAAHLNVPLENVRQYEQGDLILNWEQVRQLRSLFDCRSVFELVSKANPEFEIAPPQDSPSASERINKNSHAGHRK